MSVGNQLSKAYVDQLLSDNAVMLRAMAARAQNLMTMVNAGGDLHAALVALGFDATPNPENPGGVSDADAATAYIGYMNTLAGIYYGTVQQGGDGGTGAEKFNFHQAFAPLWGSNIS